MSASILMYGHCLVNAHMSLFGSSDAATRPVQNSVNRGCEDLLSSRVVTRTKRFKPKKRLATGACKGRGVLGALCAPKCVYAQDNKQISRSNSRLIVFWQTKRGSRRRRGAQPTVGVDGAAQRVARSWTGEGAAFPRRYRPIRAALFLQSVASIKKF